MHKGGKKEHFKIPNFIEIKKIILFSDYCGNFGS